MAKIYSSIGLVFIVLLQAYSQQDVKSRSAAYYFEKGEEALKNKSYKTALAHFNECLRLSPFYMDAYYSRALVRESMGDKQGALTDYNIYLDAKPDDKEALFSRAIGRYNYGQWAVAKEDFQKLLTMPGGETNTVYFQSDQNGGGVTKVFTAQDNLTPTFLNYLGLIETKLTNYKAAEVHFDSAIKLNPGNADFYLNRGLAKLLAGDSTGAKSDLNQTLTLNPESSLAKHNLAILTSWIGNSTEKEKLLNEAIENNPLPYSFAERGSLYMKTGNLSGALADYSEAIRLDPTEVDYWLNRGIVKEQSNDVKGALADYKRVLELKPDYEKGWLNHGNASVKLNRLSDAIEDYTVAITYYPEYGLAFYNRALTYHRMGKKELACKDLTAATRYEIVVEKKIFDTICK
ncbi:MAG: tetratricopeptide repeat protein [Cyclobacteriaceae bacterium]|nr:tetratricopeptide repeat protein [Cyclobacteriaceae bacterium]